MVYYLIAFIDSKLIIACMILNACISDYYF